MARISFFTLAIFALVGYVYCASTRETDCQRRRRMEQGATRNLTGLLVPECDEHGNYKAIQCFGQTVRGGRPFCACYDNEFGQIKGPSRNLRSCNCIREHHEWERRSRSQQGPEPRCDATSGEYNPMQCDVSSHWCVETDSGRQLGERQPGGCRESLSTNSCGVGHHGHNASQPGHHSGDHRGSHGDHHRGTSHDGTSSHDDHTSQRSGSSGSRGTSGSSGHDDSTHSSGSSRGSSGSSSHDDDSHQGSSSSSRQGSSGHSSSGTSHSSHN